MLLPRHCDLKTLIGRDQVVPIVFLQVNLDPVRAPGMGSSPPRSIHLTACGCMFRNEHPGGELESEVQVQHGSDGIHLPVVVATGVVLVVEVPFELDAPVEGKRRSPDPLRPAPRIEPTVVEQLARTYGLIRTGPIEHSFSTESRLRNRHEYSPSMNRASMRPRFETSTPPFSG